MPPAVRSAPPPDIACRCDAEKIADANAYLTEHFPDFELRNFHAPTRLLQAGLAPRHDDHHVIGLVREGILPYYTVLLSEFLAHSVGEVSACLRQWDLASALRAHRIIVVFEDRASPL